MEILEIIDRRADKLLEKAGIKNKDIQNLLEIGGIALVGYLIYKTWRGKNEK